MIDSAAYRRITSLGRQLVDSGDLTPTGADNQWDDSSQPGPTYKTGA